MMTLIIISRLHYKYSMKLLSNIIWSNSIFTEQNSDLDYFLGLWRYYKVFCTPITGDLDVTMWFFLRLEYKYTLHRV